MKLTLISDTHAKHIELDELPGGDILIHAGDLMNSGYNKLEVEFFCAWLEDQPYKYKVFIAGNHDRVFENTPVMVNDIIADYDITYLQDDSVVIDGIKIYGSPWQPAFCSWAFNLPRDGEALQAKWDAIPDDTDILVTHGPPLDHLDISGAPFNTPHIGCSLLRQRLDKYPVKIHVFGHVHGSPGIKSHEGTHFINASVLDERYKLTHDIISIEWDPERNEVS